MPERPSNVTLAVYMLYLGLGVRIMWLVLDWLLLKAPWFTYTILEWLWLLISFAVLMWLYHMIGIGKNWARIIVLILVVLETAGWIFVVANFGLFLDFSLWAFVGNLGLVQGFIRIIAMVLLYQRDSSDWFSAIKHMQPLAVSK